MRESSDTQTLLLVDTCSDRASVALFLRGLLAEEVFLPERTASSALLSVVSGVLGAAALRLRQLDGIGVVSGPGSFTGVRVGLSVVKGLAEATSLPVAAVSRLAVLAQAGKQENAVAVLHAGRHQVYTREQLADDSVQELLVSSEECRAFLAGRTVLYAEDVVLPLLATAGNIERVDISARSAFSLACRALTAGGVDLQTLDANYVRNEQAIYTRKKVGA